MLIERAVKTTIRILYEKNVFDNYDNVDAVIKDYLVIARRTPDLDELNDNDVIQRFYS